MSSPLQTKLTSWKGSELQSPNWDSYNSAAISDATINAAVELAKCLAGIKINDHEIACAVPLADGGIRLSDIHENVCVDVYASEEAKCNIDLW